MSGQTRQVLCSPHECIQEVLVAVLGTFHTSAPDLVAIGPSAQVEALQKKIFEFAALRHINEFCPVSQCCDNFSRTGRHQELFTSSQSRVAAEFNRTLTQVGQKSDSHRTFPVEKMAESTSDVDTPEFFRAHGGLRQQDPHAG